MCTDAAVRRPLQSIGPAAVLTGVLLAIRISVFNIVTNRLIYTVVIVC